MSTSYKVSNKLCSEPKYNIILQKFVNHIRDEHYASNTNFPRFEMYSLLSRRLPFCVYDNEVFTRMTTDTAFTTGDAIFINKGLFQKLIELDNDLISQGRSKYANNVLFVLLHEVAHCLNDDFTRLIGIKEPVPNIAADIANNQILFYQLGLLIDVDAFKEKVGFDLLGLSNDDMQYMGMSTESIAIDLIKDALAEIKNQQQGQQQSGDQQGQQQSGDQQGQQQSGDQQGQQQSGDQQGQQQSGDQQGQQQSGDQQGQQQSGDQQGQQQSGDQQGQQQSGDQQGQQQSGDQQGQQQSGDQQGQQQSGDQQGQQQSGDQQDQQQGDDQQAKEHVNNPEMARSIVDQLRDGLGESTVDDHTIDNNDVVEAAKEAGLSESTMDRLRLKERSIEEIEAISAENALRAQQVGQEMDTIHSRLDENQQKETTAGTRGGYYKQKTKLGDEGKISWKVAVSESMEPGNSWDTQYTEEELIDEYFSIPSMYNGVFYHSEQKDGCAIFLIDTSGSMNRKFIGDLFTEALASVDLNDPSSGFSEILLFPADVDVKDVYWSLTPENKAEVIDEVMDYGGGGTDFTNPIRNSLLKAEELELEVHTVVFGTDLGAPAPNFGYIEDQIEADNLPPVIFITDRNEAAAKGFELECEGYATVFSYANDLEIVLADVEDEIEQALTELNSMEIMSESDHDFQIVHPFIQNGM